jgi:hypothetical protein
MTNGDQNQREFERLRRIFAALPGELYAKWKPMMEDEGKRWLTDMQPRFRAPLLPVWEGPWDHRKNTNRTLRARSGFLRRSLFARTRGRNLGSLKLSVGSAGTNYAHVQEYGMTIRSRGRKMTIPYRAATTPAGNKRFSLPQAQARWGGRIRFSGDVAWRASPKGRRMTPLFYLRDQVTIPGPRSTGGPSRLGMQVIWLKGNRRRERRIVNETKRAIAAAIVKGGGRRRG